MSRKYARRLACLVILSLSLSACGVVVRQVHDVYQQASAGHWRYPGRVSPLTPAELVWAKTAWRYFVNNTNAETGLVNSIDRYPVATAWSMGDYLAALTAARQLKLIDKIEFDHRLSRFLETIAKIELNQGKLPNKFYSTKTAAMLNTSNQMGEVGWSAVDISRMLVWLKIIGVYYPEYQEYLDKVVLRWQFCEVIDDCGTLYSSFLSGQSWAVKQEGRLGYEGYAGAGFALWGFTADNARRIKLDDVVQVDNVQLLYDARDSRTSNIANPVTTPPYILFGLEFGWHEKTMPGQYGSHHHQVLKRQAQAIYQVQEQRWQRDRVFTARGEHALASPPYQVLDTIFANGQPWNTISESGQWYPDLALVSTRVVFGLWVLWDTPYTDALIKIIEALFDKDRGWYEGRYEATGAYERIITSNTNAMVLESLLYKARGQIYQSGQNVGYFQVKLDHIYGRPQHCFSIERPMCLP